MGMQNYQLYNTNILLGGQQKWDIVLESDGNLHIKDFHISPISSNVPYNTMVNENLLNYSHQENLKSYYKKVRSNFYNICPDSEFSNMWPSMSDKKVSDIYTAGVKRSKIFSTYGKQFEFLCPLWLEYINAPIRFVFEIMGNNETVIGSKTLVFEPLGKKFHDRFIQYFNNYIKYIGLNNPDTNNVINIDLLNKKSSVYGLDVESGIMKICDCNYITENLISRERPMMENDFMICDLFKSNHIISHNLFNFNFIFNIDDILSHVIENSLIGHVMKLNIRVLMGDDELQRKSFYTNYENIERYVIGDRGNNKPANVFSYLNDYKYIDQINKNKFDQQICHWSISGNNDYIFNLYKGFGSMYFEKDKRKYINTRYFNTPDLYREEYMIHFNNLNWCNFDMEFDLDDMNDFEVEQKNWEEISSDFSKEWINNVKYKQDDSIDKLYVYLGLCKSSDLIRMRLYNTLNIHKNISCRFINDKLLIISDKADLLTFRGFRNALKTIPFDEIRETCNDNKELEITYDNVLKLKHKIEDLIIYPHNIKLNGSLTQTLAGGPSPTVREVTYLKNDNIKTLQRYDGNIHPTFIDKDNTLFYNFIYAKKDVDSDKIYMLNNYADYPAIYPSLGYYYVDNYLASTYIPDNVEYKCLSHSKVLIIESNITKLIDTIDNLDNQVKDIISAANKTTQNLDYITSLYKYKYNELENGKYKINIELK